MSTATLIAAAIGVPLALLLACASPRVRTRMPALLALAPAPALAAALFGGHGPPLVVGNAQFALTFVRDAPGALLLGVAALLWILAGSYATRYLRGSPSAGGFVVCWLLTLTGCIGAFLAADLVGLYFLLAVLSVGASGLVLQGEAPHAIRAGAIYLGVALVAEAFLLAGLVMLANAMPHGSLLIRDAVAALSASPARNVTLALLIIGLGIKAGMVPMHFWMPIAYGAAPIPAAAVMSGAVVKASILALIRFLPAGAALPSVGLPLAAIGLFGALYGVAIGITQAQPRIVLAYSSVSQMGFMVAVIGMGLATGDGGTVLAAAFYAAHHVLVKGALFLAIGVIAMTGRNRLWRMLTPAAVIALGLGGLPLTGGALTKYVAKSVIGDGPAGTLAIVSSVATTLLMIQFLRRLKHSAPTDEDARAPAGLVWPWLLTAVASVALPVTLYVAMPVEMLPRALDRAALWSALWPVLLGAALAGGLDRVGRLLPRIPVGDVGVVLRSLERMAVDTEATFVRVDVFTRRWPTATIMLLVVAALIGWTLFGVG